MCYVVQVLQEKMLEESWVDAVELTKIILEELTKLLQLRPLLPRTLVSLVLPFVSSSALSVGGLYAVIVVARSGNLCAVIQKR